MVEDFLVHLLLVQIPVEKSGRPFALHADGDVAFLVLAKAVSFLVNDIDVETGNGSAEGADLMLFTGQISEKDRALSLAVAFVDVKAGKFFPLQSVGNAQGLAGGGTHLKGGDVVFADVLCNQKTIDRGRRAEIRDMVFLDIAQYILAVEVAFVLVNENAGAGHPLGDESAPAELAPTSVRDRPLQRIRRFPVPELAGGQMRPGVEIIVPHHLRQTGSAGGEVHDHGGKNGGVGGIFKILRSAGAKLAHVPPLLVAAVVREEKMHVSKIVAGFVENALQRIFRNNGLDWRHAAAVADVVRRKLRRDRNDDGAELHDGQGADPPFGPPGHHQNDDVLPLHAQSSQNIRGFVGFPCEVRVGKTLFKAVLVQPDHRKLLRISLALGVHDVNGEVEGPGRLFFSVSFQEFVILHNLNIPAILIRINSLY